MSLQKTKKNDFKIVQKHSKNTLTYSNISNLFKLAQTYFNLL